MLRCLCSVDDMDRFEVELMTLDECADFALRAGLLNFELPGRVVKLAEELGVVFHGRGEFGLQQLCYGVHHS